MGIKLEQLPERVQPIVTKFWRKQRGSFTMTDLISAGLLMLENKTPTEVFELIQKIQARSDEASAAQQVKARRHSKKKQQIEAS